ncbi:MAG: glycosyltransferase family 2 protein [Verrucomicrobia bacterium]|nr:glycosyltransferase family 2 protein [Verrucomicrobiota bacterium]
MSPATPMPASAAVDPATGRGFTIIIAAFNEQEVIAATLRRTHDFWPEAVILVVDDGSHDRTAEVVRGLAAPWLRLHSYKVNHGKGFAIARGIDFAETPYSLQLDADCQFPPEKMPELVAPLLDGRTRLVFSSRYCDGASREPGSITIAKRLASLVASGLVSVLCGQRLTDVFAGFKAWDTDYAQRLGLTDAGFGYEAELAIKAARKGETIIEIPIDYASRRAGESKIRFARDMITVPVGILRVWLFTRWKN